MGGGLVLGPVVFQGFEVPERIRFGGRQRVAVHLLPGGGRVVDVMGADETPIEWSGVFSGPNAAARVRALEQLRRDGTAVPLSWDGWLFTVVVQQFTAEAANPAWVPYRMTVCVVSVGGFADVEDMPEVASAADAEALGAGPGLDGRIAAAAGQLASDDVSAAMDAAGALARLVAARAFSGTGVAS